MLSHYDCRWFYFRRLLSPSNLYTIFGLIPLLPLACFVAVYLFVTVEIPTAVITTALIACLAGNSAWLAIENQDLNGRIADLEYRFDSHLDDEMERPEESVCVAR